MKARLFRGSIRIKSISQGTPGWSTGGVPPGAMPPPRNPDCSLGPSLRSAEVGWVYRPRYLSWKADRISGQRRTFWILRPPTHSRRDPSRAAARITSAPRSARWPAGRGANRPVKSPSLLHHLIFATGVKFYDQGCAGKKRSRP